MGNVQQLFDNLKQNTELWQLLLELDLLPVETWLAAGAVMQTVWNIQLGRPPQKGIRDYDLIYCDCENLSWEAEDLYIQQAKQIWPHLEVELRNQARVHLWYPQRFGIEIEPIQSVQAALELWPATCHAVAVRWEANQLRVIAPWGLEDLFAGQLRANPNCPDAQVFEKKIQSWQNSWPHLQSI
jgi:uncharacterized protein